MTPKLFKYFSRFAKDNEYIDILRKENLDFKFLCHLSPTQIFGTLLLKKIPYKRNEQQKFKNEIFKKNIEFLKYYTEKSNSKLFSGRIRFTGSSYKGYIFRNFAVKNKSLKEILLIFRKIARIYESYDFFAIIFFDKEEKFKGYEDTEILPNLMEFSNKNSISALEEEINKIE